MNQLSIILEAAGQCSLIYLWDSRIVSFKNERWPRICSLYHNATTIITSALKAIYMLCWIAVTDNKVSARVESSLGGKWSSRFQESIRFVEVTLSEIPSVWAPRVSGAVISRRCHTATLHWLKRAMLLSCRIIKMMAWAETQQCRVRLPCWEPWQDYSIRTGSKRQRLLSWTWKQATFHMSWIVVNSRVSPSTQSAHGVLHF